MVCWASQFERLTNYAYRQIRKRGGFRNVNVEEACNCALEQWLAIVEGQMSLADMEELDFANPPALLKRILNCRLSDARRAGNALPIGFVNPEVMDFIAISGVEQHDQALKSSEEFSEIDEGDWKHSGNAKRDFMLNTLKEYFSRVSPRTQDLIRLRLVAGRPSHEVGEVLTCSEAAVNCAVYRFVTFMRNAC